MSITSPVTSLLAPATEAVLECRAVSKRFGATTAVDDVSLAVGAGETLAVVGPSGCGKSTLLRMMAGLTGIDSGSIALAGREVAGPFTFVPAERRGVGIVFQDLALFPHLSVADNVAFGLAQHRTRRGRWPSGRPSPAQRWSPGARETRVQQMLELVGLTSFSQRFPHQLSGGEQQRVAIARALALEPDVVLLDEPFSQLDRGLAARVRDEALQTLRAAGVSVVLVTHDQDEALAVGDRVAVLRAGRLVHLAEPEEVFHRPVDRFVATFLGEADFLPGVRQGALARGPLGRLPVTPGPDGDVEVMTRPHDLTVVPWGDQAPGAEGGSGVVRRVEFRGGDVLHHVDLDGGSTVRALTTHTRRVAVGRRVMVPTPNAHPLAAFDGATPP